MQTPAVPSRLISIDALRGMASLGVFIYHAILVWEMPDKKLDWGNALFNTLRLGYEGVSLFLVLCGFVLYYPYLRRSQGNTRKVEINYLDFIKRRAWRILPTYYLVLILLIVSYSIGLRNLGVGGINAGSIVSHIFLLHNLRGNYFYTINGSFWTIALIFQFYLIFPLVVKIVARFGIKQVLVFSVLCSLLLSVLISFKSGSAPKVYLYYSLPVRLAEFLCGMMAAAVVARSNFGGKPLALRSFLIVICCLVPFCVWASLFLPKTSVGLNVGWAIIWSCCAIVSTLIPHSSSLWSLWPVRVFQAVGSFSFSVYLLHYPFLYATFPILKNFDPATRLILFFAIGLPSMLVVIYGLSFLIEKPFISAGKRRVAAKSQVLQQP